MRPELKLRLKKLRDAGAFDSADRLVFYNPDSNLIDPNFVYLSGVRAEYSVLVATARSATLYTVKMTAPLTRGSFAKVVVTDKIGAILRRNLKGRVGVNGSVLPYCLPARLKAKPIDITAALEKARAVKTPYEVAQISGAVKETRKILVGVRIEGTEQEIAAKIVYETLSRGLKPSFDPIVATGPNTASPHHVPTTRRVDGFCYVDFGVRRNNYCSDLTTPFGYSDLANRVKQALWQLEDFIKPGVKCSDLCVRAEKLLGRKMIHALGHGIGLDVHEAPHISTNSKDVLEKGMVIAIEPAIYSKNAGARVEHNYLITKNGCKRL